MRDEHHLDRSAVGRGDAQALLLAATAQHLVMDYAGDSDTRAEPCASGRRSGRHPAPKRLRSPTLVPCRCGLVHGFAVATRLEHFDTDDGTPETERWAQWHPEPANLFWLSGATTVRLPQPGHYRVFLFAFTDLPLGPTRVAPVWGRDTIMEGPEVPETLSAEDIPPARHLKSARLGLYVYVYEKPAGDDSGQFVLAQAPEQRGEPTPTWISTEFTSQLEPLVSARSGGGLQ
jgi:hypothetical protein